MYYKDFELKKDLNGQYIILNKFGDRVTQHTYKNIKEAKGVVDNVLLPEVGKNRYMPCHYRHFIWSILDNKTHRCLELSPGKIIKFNTRLEAVKWCELHQEKLNIK